MTKSISYPVVCLGHSKGIWDVSFTNDGNTFVSACHDNVPVVRNAISGEWISNLSGHSGAVWSAKFNDTGTLIATGAADLMAKVWSVATHTCIHEFPHKHVVRSVCFSPDSNFLVTGCYDFVIRIFDLQNPKNPPREIVNGKERVMKVQWSSDGKSIFSADDAGVLRKWNVEDLSCLKEVSVPNMDKESTVTDLHYAVLDTKMLPASENTHLQHNRPLLCITSGRTVSFVDDVSFQVIHSIVLSTTILSASTHPSYGRYLVVGAGMDIVIYDFLLQKEIFVHKGHHGNIHCLRFSPNGEILVTGADDATVRLWKFQDLLHQSKNDDPKVQSVYTPHTNNEHVPSVSPHDQDPVQSSAKNSYPTVHNQNPRPSIRDYHPGPNEDFPLHRQEHHNRASQHYPVAPQSAVDPRMDPDYPGHRSTVPHPPRGYDKPPPSYLDSGYPHPDNPPSHRHGHWPSGERGNPSLDAHYPPRHNYAMPRDHYGEAPPPNGNRGPVHPQQHRSAYPHRPDYSASQHSYPRNAPHPHHDYREYSRPHPNYPYSGPSYHESAPAPAGPTYRGYDVNPPHRGRMGPSHNDDMYPPEYHRPSYPKPGYPNSAPEHYAPQYSSVESSSYSHYPQSVRGHSSDQKFGPMHDAYNAQYSHTGPYATNAHYPPHSDGRPPAPGYPGVYSTTTTATSYR